MRPEFTNTQPLISIIITNYNYGRFVLEAIESALNQTHPDNEVIIVDDGSTDDSRAIIEKYHERAKVVFKENGGQASAFNAGFRVARGEVVLFLDSDDYLMSDAVNRIVANWKPNISRCHFRLRVVDKDGSQIGEVPAANTPLASGNLFERQLLANECTWVPTSGNAFSRQVLEKVFPVDERFRVCADAWLFYHSAFYGDVHAVEETLGSYRIHDSNNYVGSYVGSMSTDAQALKVFSSQLSAVHAKVDAYLSLTDGGKSLFSVAKKCMSLWEIRTLLLAKYLGVSGPVADLNHRFTFLRLHILLLAECLRNRMRFVSRLRCLIEMVILPVLTRAWRLRWLRASFDPIRRLGRRIIGKPQMSLMSGKTD